jgi:hypothetical protein
VALLDEQTGKLCGFIGSDGARNSEHDTFSVLDFRFRIFFFQGLS